MELSARYSNRSQSASFAGNAATGKEVFSTHHASAAAADKCETDRADEPTLVTANFSSHRSKLTAKRSWLRARTLPALSDRAESWNSYVTVAPSRSRFSASPVRKRIRGAATCN